MTHGRRVIYGFLVLSAATDGWRHHAVGDIFIRDFSFTNESMKKNRVLGSVADMTRQWILLVWVF